MIELFETLHPNESFEFLFLEFPSFFKRKLNKATEILRSELSATVIQPIR